MFVYPSVSFFSFKPTTFFALKSLQPLRHFTAKRKYFYAHIDHIPKRRLFYFPKRYGSVMILAWDNLIPLCKSPDKSNQKTFSMMRSTQLLYLLNAEYYHQRYDVYANQPPQFYDRPRISLLSQN